MLKEKKQRVLILLESSIDPIIVGITVIGKIRELF
jgi:hypothetical protein